MNIALQIEDSCSHSAQLSNAGKIQDVLLFDLTNMNSTTKPRTNKPVATIHDLPFRRTDSATATAQRRIRVKLARAASFSVAIRQCRSTKRASEPLQVGLRMIQNVFVLMLLISAGGSGVSRASDRSGISYTRNHLLGEQDIARRSLTDAWHDSDSAERLLGGGLVREAAEQLALASFQLDRADVCLEGHAERISSLKSAPFSYVRNEEQRRLSASYASVIQNIHGAEERIAMLHKLCSATNIQTATLNIYLVKRQEFRSRIRQGFAERSVVLTELRQLSAFPFALVRSGIVTSENVPLCHLNSDGSVKLPTGETVLPDGKAKASADNQTLTLLKQETQDLRHRMEELSRNQATASRPVLTQVTNVTVVVVAPSTATNTANATAVESPQKTQTPHGARSEAVRQPIGVSPPAATAPTTIHQTNLERALPARATRTNDTHITVTAPANAGSNSTATIFSSAANTPPVSAPIQPISAKSPRLKIAWLISAIVAVLTLASVVALALAYVNHRQNEFELFLTCLIGGIDESVTIRLDPCDQCVMLNAERPTLESRGADDGQPCIIVRTFGWPVLCPGSSQLVLLNGEPLSRPTRLHPGDVIQIGAGERFQTFTFQGGNFVSPEEQVATLESATTTIN